jgi:hypothetical protein
MIVSDGTLFFPPPFITPGTFANPTVTVNAQGRIIQISSGGSTAMAELDDFVSNSNTGSLNWTPISNGGGSGAGVTTAFADGSTYGVMDLRTGNTPGGRGGLRLASTFTNPSVPGSRLDLEWRFRIETLSTVAQDYFVNIGFTDNTTGGQGNNALALRYDDGNFIVFARVGGVETTAVDTGIAPVAGTWYRCAIRMEDGSGEVNLYDGATLLQSVSVDAAFLPTTQTFAPIALIQKQVGNTTRSLLVDYASYAFVPGGPR